MVEDKIALLRAKKDNRRLSELFGAWKQQYVDNRLERRAAKIAKTLKEEKEQLERLRLKK